MTDEEYARLYFMIGLLDHDFLEENYDLLEVSFQYAGKIEEHTHGRFWQYWDGGQLLDWLTTGEKPQNRRWRE